MITYEDRGQLVLVENKYTKVNNVTYFQLTIGHKFFSRTYKYKSKSQDRVYNLNRVVRTSLANKSYFKLRIQSRIHFINRFVRIDKLKERSTKNLKYKENNLGKIYQKICHRPAI